MAISVDTFIIETEEIARKGKVWNVRVYKKGLWKRLVSSDWFLDEQQATDFAQQTSTMLNNNSGADLMRNRKPGWTLTPPAR